MKLNSPIPSNSVKLIELYNKIVFDNLILGPDYQRKLVWKKQHKYAFIETILMNFPFPEIYIASADLDLTELKAREVVVDGQQRLTTIVEYIQGKGDFKNQKQVVPFDELSEQDKRDFLNYLITVKDLKDIGEEKIKEVFKRINSTNYSLNSNEVLNAEYGGGEFAIFCKMLADKDYSPSVAETEILLEKTKREYINAFFERNNVFSDNDIRRMFDSQYIMLISSTILEGQYFSRSSKINDYLERYNDNFSISNDVFDKIYNSIVFIDQLGFSEKSYWFNKANLFTLIIELIKFKGKVDKNLLETKLNEIENKVDIYFSGNEDELALISQDEMRYFEYAKQGSHELTARVHRGKLINEILKQSEIGSKISKGGEISNIQNINIENLESKGIEFSMIIPTETGLAKSIMDATLNVRDFLNSNNIHNYKEQEFGPLNKKKVKGHFIIPNDSNKNTEVSLYRSNGRGDYRIWFSDLKEFADPNNVLVLVIEKNEINVLNISKYDYNKYIQSLNNN